MRGLVKQLQKYNIKQTIITNAPTSIEERYTTEFQSDIKIFELRAKKIGPAYMILPGLSRILKDNEYDLINVHGFGLYPADMTCLLKRIGILKTPILLTTLSIAGLKNGYLALRHSFPLPPKQRIIRASNLLHSFTLGKLQMTTFDKVIVLSEDEKKLLSRIGLKENKAIDIPIAVNDIFFKQSLPKERKYILYAGRINRYKGIQILLKAFSELKLEDTGIKCLIVGRDEGYRSELLSIIDELDITDLVEIRDQVSQEDLVDIYSSALVTVLPSSSEGFPLSLVESMARGTPFIATPVGHIPELVSKTRAGMVVPVGDSEALTKALLSLLYNKEVLEDMSANGERFARGYSWKIVGKMYYDLYEDLVKCKNSALE